MRDFFLQYPDIRRMGDLNGISLNGNFDGKSDLVNILNSFSAGEKNMASLAFILSILMVDCSPLYLLELSNMVIYKYI